MLTSSECWMQNICPRKDDPKAPCKSGEEFCIREFKLDCLFEQTLLTKKQREFVPLYLDEKETDKIPYERLSNISKDIIRFVKKGKNLYIHSSKCGNGKAQPDNSLVLTKNGYKMMGEIKENEEIYGEDGKLYKVIGKFNRGLRKVYRITFSDNKSVECCNEHLWTVHNKELNKDETIELQDLIDNLTMTDGSYKYTIPITKPIPYIDNYENTITYEDLGKAYSDGYIDGGILNNENFDLATYEKTSISERITYLKGIFDNSGKRIKSELKGKYVIELNIKKYSNVIKISDIIESIGGICKIETVKEGFKCLIQTPSDIKPFSSPILDTVLEPVREVIKIEFIGLKHCYCIMTNNPTQLYITDHYIVTHNTAWAIRLIHNYLYNIWPECNMECHALFINVPRFLLALKDNIQVKNDYVEYIKSNVLNADIVVWDEVATKSLTTYEHEHLLSLINARLDSGKSNIYTSNLLPEDIKILLGERLFSRIVESSEEIVFNGSDMRYWSKVVVKEPSAKASGL